MVFHENRQPHFFQKHRMMLQNLLSAAVVIGVASITVFVKSSMKVTDLQDFIHLQATLFQGQAGPLNI